MTYQKNEKDKLTSRFIGLKIMAIFFFLICGLLLFLLFLQFHMGIAIVALILTLLGSSFWYFTKTRKQVYYDGEHFHLFTWKGEQIESVANSQITAMVLSGFGAGTFGAAQRVFYKSKDGTKKDFYIYPNLRTNTGTLKQKLKKMNPDLLTEHFSFGGIEHLFIKDDDWFR